MGKETKQDATEQRLKSLKAQNEAAKIALKQRELDIAEREQEFVEPSEFQRAKILTEMLPSRGGSSLGAQAIRMPMSRPKPIYSPNALRTPIASPQEEIEAKHLDMLDELDQVDQEKIQSLRSKYDYINEMAVRAQKLGFDITGGRGYDPSNEAHREIHEEYVRLRGQAIDEGRRLQELKKTREKMLELYGKDHEGIDYSKLSTVKDLYGIPEEAVPKDPWSFVTTFNASIESANTTEQLESERKRLEAAQQHADNRIQSARTPEQARYWQEQKTLLQNTYKNLEERKLYLKQQELKDKKAREDAKGDKDVMNVKKIVDPFVLLQEGMGGQEIGEGATSWNWSGFIQDGNRIDEVIRNADGSIDVLVSGKSTEKDKEGKYTGWREIDYPIQFDNAYDFFNAYMRDKNNELDVDRVDFFNKVEEYNYGREGVFNPSNVLDDYESKKATRKEQTAFEKTFDTYTNDELNKIKNELLAENKIEFTWKDGETYKVQPDGKFNFITGDPQFEVVDEKGEHIKDSDWLKDYEKEEDFFIDEIMEIMKQNNYAFTADRKVWVSKDGTIINNPTQQNEKFGKQMTFREYGKKYVDKYKGGSKSKTTEKEESKETEDKVEAKYKDYLD